MTNLAHVSQHGVMLNVAEHGLLITGNPGIGKSSLALAFLDDGQQFIADDLIELSRQNDMLIASCPAASKGLLHHRELGLIDVEKVWGKQAVKYSQRVDAVIGLTATPAKQIEFQTEQQIALLDIRLPFIRLCVDSTCSLTSKIYTWLKNRPFQAETVAQFQQKQQQMMQQ